jgi:hypothetical protein
MKRLVKVVISLSIALLLVTPAATAKRVPVLSVAVGDIDVAIAGRGFHPRERVVVRVLVNAARTTRVIRADARGRFSTKVGVADEGSCSQPTTIVVAAAGGGGSRATATRHVPIPASCGIAPQP